MADAEHYTISCMQCDWQEGGLTYNQLKDGQRCPECHFIVQYAPEYREQSGASETDASDPNA